MAPFDTYKAYISLKNHFSKPSYDYFKYAGKVRANLQSFYKRRDRFWFEKLARNKDDKEIVNFFVSNFIQADDPSNVWIGNIIRNGDSYHREWMKRQQSLSYIFKEESEKLFEQNKFEKVFDCSKGHPILLRKFLGGEISIETMVIYDRIFMYGKNFDKKLKDPVWETVSLKLSKYEPFLKINIFDYKKILKEVIVGDL